MLASQKNFDPDVQVCLLYMFLCWSANLFQDASGWTPLMIAVSLKEGEELVDLFLRKEADVNAKSMPFYSLPSPLYC